VLSSSAKITKVHGSENVGKKRLNTSNIQVKPDVHSYNDTKLLKEVSAGIDVLSQVINTESWWDWDNGSALLYWRWNTASQRQEARDGTKIHVRGTLPKKMRGTRPPVKSKRKQIAAKVSKVRKRRYILSGFGQEPDGLLRRSKRRR
jgi:hypothetical protein